MTLSTWYCSVSLNASKVSSCEAVNISVELLIMLYMNYCMLLCIIRTLITLPIGEKYEYKSISS